MASLDDAFEVSVGNPQTILFSSDVERASRFYQRLGFVETFRVPSDGAAIHADLELDGYKIADPDGHPVQLAQQLSR
jgi:catechol 2,3-dioxygenase-like lactoylglutathione lyase family enzyme